MLITVALIPPAVRVFLKNPPALITSGMELSVFVVVNLFTYAALIRVMLGALLVVTVVPNPLQVESYGMVAMLIPMFGPPVPNFLTSRGSPLFLVFTVYIARPLAVGFRAIGGVDAIAFLGALDWL